MQHGFYRPASYHKLARRFGRQWQSRGLEHFQTSTSLPQMEPKARMIQGWRVRHGATIRIRRRISASNTPLPNPAFPARLPLASQSALQLVIGRRPVEPVLHVIFASPENHDGLARGLCGYLRRFHDKVGLVTAAKATPISVVCTITFSEGSLAASAITPCAHCGACVGTSFGAVRANLYGAVHRFHASVRREGSS